MKDRDWFTRAAAVALPVLAFLLLAETALGVLRQPFLLWNEIRLSRAIALARGFPLYLGQFDSGPVIGTLHTPLSHLVYSFATLLPHPTEGILAASALSALLVFGSLAWVLIDSRGGAKRSLTALVFLFCAFLIVETPGAYNIAFMVHTDAAAIALAIVAAGLLARPAARCPGGALWICAFCMVLSVWSKQTILPIVFAGAAFVWFVDGTARFGRLVLRIGVAGGLVLGATVLVFPARAFFFNVVTLSVSRPLKPGALALLAETFRDAKLDSILALTIMAFFLLHQWPRAGSVVEKFRAMTSENRWLVFALFGMSMIPGSARAVLTVWADVNHVGLILIFWFTAAGLALLQFVDAPDAFLRKSARIFLAVGIAVTLPPGAAFALPAAFRDVWKNNSETAYAYELKHPGSAYFPKSPVAALLAENKLYHLDAALRDREVVGYALTDAQLLSGLPKTYHIVAVPAGEIIESESLRKAFAAYRPVADPELPGWSVYEKPR